jgi:hypothetical protein
VDVALHLFLTLELDGVAGSDSQTSYFNSQGYSPQYPSNRRMGGPHSQFPNFGEEKYLLLHLWTFCSLARPSIVCIKTETSSILIL